MLVAAVPAFLQDSPAKATLIVAPAPQARASALSYDGRTLAGVSLGRAFLWRLPQVSQVEGEETESLEILSNPGTALALSDDGSTVVGNGLEPGRGKHASGRWIGTIPSMTPPVGPRIGGIAAGVSGDGTVVVGSAIFEYVATRPSSNRSHVEGRGEAAILWLGRGEEWEIEGLKLGWGSAATAVSRDGLTIVGTLPRRGPGFRWTREEGAQTIGDLPGGTVETVPHSLSAEGTVIIGAARGKNGVEAFRWTRKDGMTPLGDLEGATFRSVARGVSGDGRIVVGFGTGAEIGLSDAGERAVVWDAEGGIHDLWSLLKSAEGMPEGFDGWRLVEAVSVRRLPEDRLQIAGSAKDHSGRDLVFVATLAEPKAR